MQCLKCKDRFTPRDLREIPYCGENLMTWSINQHIQHGVSFSHITEILLDSFNIQLSSDEICTFKRKLAKKYTETYEEIKRCVINGNLIHADETESKLKGASKGYVWVFTNMDSVFYLFKHTREAEFLKDLLKGYKGVLVSDFYPGYDSLPCPQQKCLVVDFANTHEVA